MTLGLKSDPLLREILSEALRERSEVLQVGEFGLPVDAWAAQYEAAVFTREAAASELTRMWHANLSERRYDLQDYHALLLYSALSDWVSDHCIRAGESGSSRIGPFLVGMVELDHLVDTIFWDTDFLLPPEVVNHPAANKALRLTQDAFSIANGLKPHPVELVLAERPDLEWSESVRGYSHGEDYPVGCEDCTHEDLDPACGYNTVWDFVP